MCLVSIQDYYRYGMDWLKQEARYRGRQEALGTAPVAASATSSLPPRGTAPVPAQPSTQCGTDPVHTQRKPTSSAPLHQDPPRGTAPVPAQPYSRKTQDKSQHSTKVVSPLIPLGKPQLNTSVVPTSVPRGEVTSSSVSPVRKNIKLLNFRDSESIL